VLRLLLDEHLSENIATSSQSLAADIIIASMVSWEEGAFQGQEDDVLLKAAHVRGWTLVTWDQRTIAPLLQTCAGQGISHGGVVFCNRQTLATSDFGGIARALMRLWREQGDLEWTDRVVYLTRA